ncbi:MAG: hypothetical protein II748_04985, partial [Clostridia bacterium]|nr:hypothetical protein [Clostridia bacterium]
MVHAQSFGWLDTVKNGEIGGTEGKSKRVEAIAITLDTQGLLAKDGSELTGGISYRVHAQSVGWMDPVTVEANSTSPASMVAAGKYAGTTGHGYRLEAIEISLTGAVAEEYDVIYRAHVQKIGWMGWVKNGATAGT